MYKIVKPDYTYQWASAAGGGSVAPNSTKIQTGHIVEKPNYEYMNWLQNRQDTAIAYTFQMGVPEWDSLVEYQYHANYKSYVQRNGLIYKALQVGTNKDPATEAAYWALAFDNYGSAATVQTNLNTHITNYGTLASLSNVATARTNLDVYSKGEGDGRYAKLAGLNTQLFLVANGTTGYEAVNYQQLVTKAPVAGNSGQEFAVATATTGNSAVNKTQFDAKTGDASTTAKGLVEKATQAEMNAGTADKFPSAAEIFSGFAQSTDTFTLPEFMGGWKVKWGEKIVGDISPFLTDTASITGFSTISTVLVGGIDNHASGVLFTVHRKSFDDGSVTVKFDEGSSGIQNCGYWWCAIGK